VAFFKRLHKKCVPFEQFFEREYRSQEDKGSFFKCLTNMKKKYAKLSDLEKLEFIKEAMYAFNHCDVRFLKIVS
jgi:hypothetical protein